MNNAMNNIDINQLMQAMQLMQMMQGLQQQSAAPVQDKHDGQRFTVVRTLNAFKATTGIHKGKWMLSAGDVLVEWNGLVPKDAFVKGKKCLTTRTKWELVVGASRTGKLYGVSAKDTGEAYTKDDLDDVGPEDGLDGIGDDESAVQQNGDI